MSAGLAAALDELEALLARQAEAVRAGEADALPSLNEQLQQRIALLSRAAVGRAVPPEFRSRIVALARRVGGTQAVLARRQQHLDAALAVFEPHHAGLQQARAATVYGNRGGFRSGGFGSGGFERA